MAPADGVGMQSFRSAAATGVLAVLVLALAAAPAAAAPSANTAALQVALRALHHYSGSIDGVRGPGTTRGVRIFQKSHHLPVDGIVGPRTLSALGVRGAPPLGHRVMRRGERGWDVAALQFLLQRRGFSPGSIDGGFGAGTDAALRRYQRSAGLTADGRAGSATLHAVVHGARPSSSGGGSNSGHGSASGSPSGPVRFLRPVSAPITSPFGMRWGRMHTGIDFGAPAGAPIRAAGVGTVISAGWNSGGYGNLVVIQHRLGYETWYAHQSRVAVHAGQRVNGGTLIGYVGATGHATGPHLHFEVRIHGTPVNLRSPTCSRVSRRSRPPARPRAASDAAQNGVPSTADRARRGGSGALHPQSALAGPNPRPRGWALGASTPVEGVDGQVPRGERSRTRSDPGGSSLKRYRSRAVGKPGWSLRPAGTPGTPQRRRVHGPLLTSQFLAATTKDPRHRSAASVQDP